jgi:hypothetical protein
MVGQKTGDPDYAHPHVLYLPVVFHVRFSHHHLLHYGFYPGTQGKLQTEKLQAQECLGSLRLTYFLFKHCGSYFGLPLFLFQSISGAEFCRYFTLSD